jgi:hypothetical protein
VKQSSEAQRRVFKGPISLGRQSDKPPEAGQCTCEPWPCAGPASAQWATCLGHRCKGCRSAG